MRNAESGRIEKVQDWAGTSATKGRRTQNFERALKRVAQVRPVLRQDEGFR